MRAFKCACAYKRQRRDNIEISYCFLYIKKHKSNVEIYFNATLTSDSHKGCKIL